jgi:hypothetical protein
MTTVFLKIDGHATQHSNIFALLDDTITLCVKTTSTPLQFIMRDAIVQFIRNALCCAKDLHWFSDTFLNQPDVTKSYLSTLVELPDPLDKTTPLEFLISLTQLYACISTSTAGLFLIWNSIGKLRRIVRLMEARSTAERPDQASATFLAANRIVNESMMQQARSAIRGVMVGFLVAPIGVAFFWLFANSWHVTETPWIGGLLGLIDALTVMEFCLLPLLAYMVVDSMDFFAKVRKTKELIRTIESDSFSSADALNLTKFEFMKPNWAPFWEAVTSPVAAAPLVAEEMKKVNMEVSAVEQSLKQWFPENKESEKEQKIRAQALDKAVDIMDASLNGLTIKGYREMLYFVLNFIAFYGYLMGIVAFYFPDDAAQPGYVTQMKFGYGNALADWTGNFAGDLMWTIEPMVILTSPLYLSRVQLASSKKRTFAGISLGEKTKKD